MTTSSRFQRYAALREFMLAENACGVGVV